jgi:hypothetical protein
MRFHVDIIETETLPTSELIALAVTVSLDTSEADEMLFEQC